MGRAPHAAIQQVLNLVELDAGQGFWEILRPGGPDRRTPWLFMAKQLLVFNRPGRDIPYVVSI
jgi:hypothetical protein